MINEQRVCFDVKCICDDLDILERDVSFTALEGTDVCAMQAALLGKVFLRKAEALSARAYISGKDLKNVHGYPLSEYP